MRKYDKIIAKQNDFFKVRFKKDNKFSLIHNKGSKIHENSKRKAKPHSISNTIRIDFETYRKMILNQMMPDMKCPF